jgi:hypothetical protein
LALVLVAVPLQSGRSATVAPTLFLSPSGSDAAPCTRQQPCASLGRALALAVPGQVVELAAGAYPGQGLDPVPKASSEHVVFQPAPGASVSFTGRLELNGVSHVTLSRFSLARTGPADRSLFVTACTTDVTLDNLSGETFFVEEGTSQIQFHGGSWGGYSAPDEADSAIGTSGPTGPTYTCNGQPAGPASGIVFDGVTFHDVFWGVPSSAWGGSHPDCFEINGYADGVVVRNSRFVRCASTFMQINPDQGNIANATFENNVYTQLGDESWYGIQITSDGKPGRCQNVIFRHNTYLPGNVHATTWPNGPIRTDCEPISTAPSVQVVANLFARAPPANECARYVASPYGAAWQDNLFGSDACGLRPRTGLPFGYRLGPGGLEPEASAAGIVRRLFRLAAQGTTAVKVARLLAAARARPPRGHRWSAATVVALLRDPVYAGGVYGAAGSSPALVPRSTWRAAQPGSAKP